MNQAIQLCLAALLSVAFVVATASTARADCAGPYECACLDDPYIAEVVDVQPNDTITLRVEAVGNGQIWPEVGAEFQLKHHPDIALNSRWLVVEGRDDQYPGALYRDLTADAPIACLTTSFTAKRVLDLSARGDYNDCRAAAGTDPGVDDTFTCADEDVHSGCALAPTATSASLHGWALALLLGIPLWLRRRRR